MFLTLSNVHEPNKVIVLCTSVKKRKVSNVRSFNFICFIGCETWHLSLGAEHRERVFEKGMLRGVFGPQREEMTEGRRKLRNEERHNLYTSTNIIRVMKPKRVTSGETFNKHWWGGGGGGGVKTYFWRELWGEGGRGGDLVKGGG